MVNLKNLEPREYQKNIAKTAIKKNTLVVLPTGTGKTLIAILVSIERLKKYPDSRILITAPTRPLNAQHKKSLEEFTDIPEEEIVLITGKIKPEKREKLYQNKKIIVATPQTIRNDLKNERLNLKNFSLIVFDECHRCVKDYAYTYIAKKFMLQSKHPLILGLTASPGGSRERIKEICKNLFIKAVEIRSEVDEDVSPYVKEIKKTWIYVELPEEFKKIKTILEEILEENLKWLKERRYIPISKPTKKMLLELQKKLMSRYMRGSKNYSLFWAMIKSVEAIKVGYALELLETQGVFPLFSYLKKLEKSKKKTDKRLFKDPRIREVSKLVEELCEKEVEHPKLKKVQQVVLELVKKKPDTKIIVFANYRSTVEKINELLKLKGIKSEILVGQAIKNGKGLTQKQQIEIIKRFADKEFNVLVTSSIGEEGLDIAETDYAIFYEPVPSEIRMIQRRGRVGRQVAGEVIFLITKDTRDEAYYFSALRKEKKMKKILYKMKEKGIKRKETLLDWVK